MHNSLLANPRKLGFANINIVLGGSMLEWIRNKFSFCLAVSYVLVIIGSLILGYETYYIKGMIIGGIVASLVYTLFFGLAVTIVHISESIDKIVSTLENMNNKVQNEEITKTNNNSLKNEEPCKMCKTLIPKDSILCPHCGALL